MKPTEKMNYLLSLIHKSANENAIQQLIETLPTNELEYAYNYVLSIEEISGKDSVHIIEIKKDNILFIRVECFLQVKL